MNSKEKSIINYAYHNKIGKYTLEETNGFLTHLWFGEILLSKNQEISETLLLQESKVQLDAYFEKRLKEFSLPLAPSGTDFQLKIWQLLCNIPYGETRTYGNIAQQAGNAKACRAVGMANNRNPLPIIIPCHRVIGTNGSLTGYAGGLDIKQILLNHERN